MTARTADPDTSRYDDREVVLPRVEALRAGDVLLTSNVESASRTGNKQSAVIRRFTRGSFSHALICSEPPTLIEAIGTGVSTLSLARCFAHARDNVRVLRHRDAAVARRASELAQLEVGRDYSIPKAAQSILSARTIAKVRDDGVFCSALVAAAFIQAGAADFARTPAEKTTPATIERMDTLDDVTDEVFRAAPAPANVESMTALDGDAAPTLSARQTEISNRYARQLLPTAELLARGFPELGLTITPTLFGIMDLLLKAMDRLARLDAQSRPPADRAVRQLDVALGRLIASGELATLLHEIRTLDEGTFQEALRESFNPQPDIDAGAMRGLLETTKRELTTRRASYDAMSKWNGGRSAAATTYLAIEEGVLESLALRIPLLDEILRRIT